MHELFAFVKEFLFFGFFLFFVILSLFFAGGYVLLPGILLLVLVVIIGLAVEEFVEVQTLFDLIHLLLLLLGAKLLLLSRDLGVMENVKI